jgi:hypothetical protein
VFEEVKGKCKAEVRHVASKGNRKVMRGVDTEIWEKVMKGYMKERVRKKKGLKAVAVVKEEMRLEDKWHEKAVAIDDVSGVTLEPRKVLKARLEEVEWMRQKGVYKEITRRKAK